MFTEPFATAMAYLMKQKLRQLEFKKPNLLFCTTQVGRKFQINFVAQYCIVLYTNIPDIHIGKKKGTDTQTSV